MKKLPKHIVGAIEEAVNSYGVTKCGSPSTTVANTLLALQNLEKRGRAYADALDLFADERAGVDDKTLSLLQPLAKATLQEHPGAKQALITAARKRRAELAHHPRITTSTEPMRVFCGFLRIIFNNATLHLKRKITEKAAWHRCSLFALAIFDAAGIEHADFDAHPERLIEYLGTDVSAN